MALTPVHRTQLIEALADAFQSADDLRTMLQIRLNLNLNRISGTGNLDTQLSELLEWASSEGRLSDLLHAATRQKPDNPLLRQLQIETIVAAATTAPLACPYPGLEPYKEGQALFGRDKEVERALDALDTAGFLPVIGPTGSGKSSFVFAGLVPAARRDPRFASSPLDCRSLRPGTDPLARLTETLAQLERTGSTSRTLLIVDQFEELFAPNQGRSRDAARATAREFAERLRGMLAVRNGWLVLTARADFYHELMGLPLWPVISAHRFEILPLDDKGLRDAITNPAERVGVHVDRGLVERIVADAAREPGSLPLVQETLVLLWSRLRGDRLSLEQYLALGDENRTGLQAAIARRANAVLAELSLVIGDDAEAKRRATGREAIARRIFVRLVQFGDGGPDTRRQQPVSALRVTEENPLEFDETLELLIGKRLLTATGSAKAPPDAGTGAVTSAAPPREGERLIDLAHEALITGWPTLAEWIAASRLHEQLRRRLEQQGREWSERGGAVTGLLDEGELAEADRWFGQAAAEVGDASFIPPFLTASRAHLAAEAAEREAFQGRELDNARRLAQEQKLRADETARRARTFKRLLSALGIVLGIAIWLGVAAWFALQESRRQGRISVLQSLAALAPRQQASLEFERGALLARQAWMMSGREGGASAALVDDALRASLSAPGFATVIPTGAAQITDFEFSPDGETLAVSSKDGKVQLLEWRKPGTRPIVLDGPALGAERVLFAGSSSRLVTIGRRGDVRLYTLGSGGATGSGTPQSRTFEVPPGTPPPDPDIDPPAFPLAVASTDGRWVATAGAHTALLFDLNGPATHPSVLVDGTVGAMAFHPRKPLIAVIDIDGIGLIDLENGSPKPVLQRRQCGPDEPQLIQSNLTFSPDGERFAVLKVDPSPYIFECSLTAEKWERHDADWVEDWVYPPSSGLLTVSMNLNVRLQAGPFERDWLDDTTLSAAFGGTLTDEPVVARLTPAGEAVAVYGRQILRVVALSILRNEPAVSPTPVRDGAPGSEGIEMLLFSSDGSGVSVSHRVGGRRIERWFGTRRARGRTSGQEPGLLALPVLPDDYFSVDVSATSQSGVHGLVIPPGKRAALIAGDKLHTWNWGIGTAFDLSHVPLGTPGSLSALAHDGYVAWSDGPRTFRVASVERELDVNRAVVLTRSRDRPATALALSSDGSKLSAGFDDGRIEIWDVQRPKDPPSELDDDLNLAPAAQKPSAGQNTRRPPVRSLMFDRSGTRVAAGYGDGVILYWELGSIVIGPYRLFDPASSGAPLALSAAGDRLASGGAGGITRLWDLTDKQAEPLVLRGATDATLTAVAWSDDGRSLLTGHARGEIFRWAPRTADVADAVCQKVWRNLSMAEWREFIGDDVPYERTCASLPSGEGAPADAPAAH